MGTRKAGWIDRLRNTSEIHDKYNDVHDKNSLNELNTNRNANEHTNTHKSMQRTIEQTNRANQQIIRPLL